jgi:hypothetical protein
MLDKVLTNALEGFTVIEEDVGSVSKILAKQLGGYAGAGGKRVGFVSLSTEEWRTAGREAQQIQQGPGIRVTSSSTERTSDRDLGLPFLDAGNYELLIVDALSSYLFDKTESEVIETVMQVARAARQGRNFIITYDPALLGEKASAYLQAAADSVIIVKTDIIADRVNRTLYIPKMRNSKPMDRLVKITVDESGVQMDTREFVG